MEPLAENRFVITKELYYEGALRVDWERMGPFIKKVMLALAAAWAVLAAATLFSQGSVVFVLIELAVIALVARDGFVTGSADLVWELIEQYRAAPDDADEDEDADE